MVLSEVAVDIVAVEDEARFRDLMQAHHYLGAVPGMALTAAGGQSRIHGGASLAILAKTGQSSAWAPGR